MKTLYLLSMKCAARLHRRCVPVKPFTEEVLGRVPVKIIGRQHCSCRCHETSRA